MSCHDFTGDRFTPHDHFPAPAPLQLPFFVALCNLFFSITMQARYANYRQRRKSTAWELIKQQGRTSWLIYDGNNSRDSTTGTLGPSSEHAQSAFYETDRTRPAPGSLAAGKTKHGNLYSLKQKWKREQLTHYYYAHYSYHYIS